MTLRGAAALDHEGNATLDIRVRATDERNASMEKVFAITVTDVNEAPTAIDLNGTSVAENLPVISLFANPIWYEYSTRRFSGWVTEEDQKFRPQVHDGTRERVWHALALKPIEGAQF